MLEWVHCILGKIGSVEFKMASPFPASAQMKQMAAGVPQQAGMYQRPQYQQSSYGIQVW